MNDSQRPNASTPPKPMSERTLRTTLEAIDKKCGENGEAIGALQTIEDTRAGAAKFGRLLLGVFGGTITAGAIGLFVWVWDAQTSNALQDAAILQVEQRAAEHDPTPPGHEDLDAHDAALDRRVDANENANKAITMRLDRMETTATKRNADVLTELRRLRTRRATWGGN